MSPAAGRQSTNVSITDSVIVTGPSSQESVVEPGQELGFLTPNPGCFPMVYTAFLLCLASSKVTARLSPCRF